MCGMCRLPRRAFLAGALALRSARAEEARPVEPRPVEPGLRLPASTGAPRVALTLDCCPGAFDARIAHALVDLGATATMFVTGLWMTRNRAGLAFLRAHPDIFAIENHGARHLPPVFGDTPIFGIRPAGDLAAIRAEVEGGGQAIAGATGVRPGWYRAATGFYSAAAIAPIEALGYRIAGYSLNGDLGASLPADKVAARIAAAQDGDVIVAHGNQPLRASGAGVVEGVRRLRARGMAFARLPA